MTHSKHIHGTLEARFWPKVDKSGDCWIWTGAKLPKGYGRINDGEGHTLNAHRVAWKLHYGEYPSLNVLHRCDNPSCVRIDHLFLGSLADNNEDMRQKSRKWTKLTREQVDEIRNALAAMPIRERGKGHAQALATRFGVSLGLIYHIKTGRAWFHSK